MNKRNERLKKLADIDSIIQDNKDFLKMILPNDMVSTPKQTEPTQTIPEKNQNEQFNINDAMIYNSKLEQAFKNYSDDVKRLLGTSANWSSPEFAKATYNWQKNNGFSGNLIDGKLGPATIGKMAKLDPELGKKYDAYAGLKSKYINEKPHQKVINLTAEVDRIRKEMNADIPLNLLMGWIQVESGGKLNDLTTSAGIREAGLFQISDEEAKAIGADQDKVLEDQDYAIKTGIQLAQHHADKVDQVLSQYPIMKQTFPKGSDMYWRLAMFGFSAGDGTMIKFVHNMANSNEEFNSWDDVMKFAASNPSNYKHSPTKWLAHIDKAFNIGNQITGQQQKMANKIFLRIKKTRKLARQLFAK